MSASILIYGVILGFSFDHTAEKYFAKNSEDSCKKCCIVKGLERSKSQ